MPAGWSARPRRSPAQGGGGRLGLPMSREVFVGVTEKLTWEWKRNRKRRSPRGDWRETWTTGWRSHRGGGRVADTVGSDRSGWRAFGVSLPGIGPATESSAD